jgi:hypothetical protein
MNTTRPDIRMPHTGNSGERGCNETSAERFDSLDIYICGLRGRAPSGHWHRHPSYIASIFTSFKSGTDGRRRHEQGVVREL